MDHRAAIAQIPAQRLAALNTRRDLPGLLHLAGHLGLIATTGTGIALAVPGWPLLLPLHGVLLVFLFTLEHEATHQTPFKTPWLNETTGHLCGLLLFLPFTWFRYFHLAHHRFTNDPDRDPELIAGGHPTTWPRYLAHVSGLPYWLSAARTLIRNAQGPQSDSFTPTRAKPRITAEARAYLAAYALAALSLLASPALLWLWLLPIFLGQPFLRLYLLAEHGRCPHVADMLANTRTTFTSGALRFIAWNMPYHIEHHSLPQVPFHNLPHLHQDLAHALKSTAPSYRHFTQDYVTSLGPKK